VALIDTIELIAAEVGARPRLQWTRHQRGDARDTAADTSRITRELGFAPAWDLAGGLAAQVAWQKRTVDLLVTSS
jgi:nucleoside-diphosphate-sugar epimerase